MDQGLGPHLVFEKLGEQIGFTGSGSTACRMCAKLKSAQRPSVVMRIDTPQAKVAQVDFGAVRELGDLLARQSGRNLVLSKVLGRSRHICAEFAPDQTITT